MTNPKAKAVETETEILGFFEHYRWLSNFHLVEIDFEGLKFPSTENAYQAAKTLDLEQRKKFQFIPPNESKKLGQKVKLREDWEQVKFQVMENVNQTKFQDEELKRKILGTGDKELVEANWWNDVFWGRCNGIGENNLGKILMKIRKDIRRKEALEWFEGVLKDLEKLPEPITGVLAGGDGK